jgi:hypothetical protein
MTCIEDARCRALDALADRLGGDPSEQCFGDATARLSAGLFGS